MEVLRGNPLLLGFVIAWAAVTAALLLMLLYRMTMESHEDDQVFLDPAQDRMAKEQKALVARIERINKPIRGLVVASSLFFLCVAGTWLYDVYQHLNSH